MLKFILIQTITILQNRSATNATKIIHFAEIFPGVMSLMSLFNLYTQLYIFISPKGFCMNTTDFAQY